MDWIEQIKGGFGLLWIGLFRVLPSCRPVVSVVLSSAEGAVLICEYKDSPKANPHLTMHLHHGTARFNFRWGYKACRAILDWP